MDELWVVRHGETQWSADGRHTSVTDVPLTEAGEDAARSLASRLDGVDFELVLTSPAQRARRTAALAGFLDAEVDEDLREWEYGEYEGVTTEEIHRHDPSWTVWSRPCPGGETAVQVADRLDRVVARARAANGAVLVFGHGHASRVLAARWLALPPQEGRLLVLGTATISVLGSEHAAPAVVRWNC